MIDKIILTEINTELPVRVTLRNKVKIKQYNNDRYSSIYVVFFYT